MSVSSGTSMLNSESLQSKSELEESLSLALAAETKGIQTIEKLVSQHGEHNLLKLMILSVV